MTQIYNMWQSKSTVECSAFNRLALMVSELTLQIIILNETKACTVGTGFSWYLSGFTCVYWDNRKIGHDYLACFQFFAIRDPFPHHWKLLNIRITITIVYNCIKLIVNDFD
jgi:hypothetical protein